MKWFKKDILLLAITFITLTGGVKKVFAIEEANEDQKTTLIEGKNDLEDPFLGLEPGSYVRDLVSLWTYIQEHYPVTSLSCPPDVKNLYNFATITVPQDKATSIDNCWKFANYTNTFRNADPNLAKTVFVTSVRCMLTTHYFKIRAAFHKFKKHGSPVYIKVCDHFKRENGLLNTLINDINSWNTKYYRELEVGKPPLSFVQGTFYEQKKYIIRLLNEAEGIVPSCPLPSFASLFAETKDKVNLLAFSGPSIK